MIFLKSPEEIEKMSASGRLVAEILSEVRDRIKPGVTTQELDLLASRLSLKKKARPAFKGYKGYPFSLCVSVNEEVVHGFPSKRRLMDGDIVSLDFGVYLDGYYGDAALTQAVGRVTSQAERLIQVTKEALLKGLEQIRAGRRLGDISCAVQQHVEGNRFSVVRQFVGHGIGKALHEDPQIPNFGEAGRGILLKPGMVLAIEPMVNAGGSEVEIKADGWTAVTKDRSLSAHFEHTIAITENGCRILTQVCHGMPLF
ncbi:MAG: type I methionyl aminopeptidase [Deltaproteobacteria bacterium RBG_13_43_22]|jgi:methionyl aminopeptidase|nr:MAG: type I methionyl aminopeptidase [Deltaproteobacteria bacterium RBG_13_43_22]